MNPLMLARAALIFCLLVIAVGGPAGSPAYAAGLAQSGDSDHQLFIPAVLRYTSNLNDSFEPNDNQTMAYSPQNVSWVIDSRISRVDDQDWYAIDVTTPGWIHIELCGLNHSELCPVEMELYDSNGLGVGFSTNDHHYSFSFQTLTPGRYYVRLTLAQNLSEITETSYRLTARFNLPTQGDGEIYGVVKANGVPLPNIPVRLEAALPVFTLTDQTGTYHFKEIPTVSYGGYYEVTFANWSTLGPAYAGFAATPPTAGYSTHEVRKMADLDISPIDLLLPDPGAHLTPPFEFGWNVRPTSPLEWYGVYICCSDDNNVWSTGLVGREDRFMLHERPADLPAETLLYWGAYAYTEDYSYAESYYAYYLSFHMPELGPHSLVVQEQRLPLEQLKERERKEPPPARR